MPRNRYLEPLAYRRDRHPYHRTSTSPTLWSFVDGEVAGFPQSR